MAFATNPDAADVFVECNYPTCTERGPKREFIGGDYCTEYCETRHDGRETLRKVVHDHRYCGLCFRQLKEVTDPPSERFWSGFQTETRQAFIGYQYRTPAADTGERLRRDDAVPLIGTGTVCGTCGTTATNDPTPWGELFDIGELAARFCAALAREDPDAAIDRERVVDVATETGDLELAAGRGVESGP